MKTDLTQSTTAGPWWAPRVAEHCDITVEAAARLAPLFDDPSCWMLTEVEGVLRIRLPTGKHRRANAVALRLAPGARFPALAKGTKAHVLVLQGSLRQGEERRVTAEAGLTALGPSPHPLESAGAEECVCCIFPVHGT